MYISNIYLGITWTTNSVAVGSYTKDAAPWLVAEVYSPPEELTRDKHFYFSKVREYHWKGLLFRILPWLVSSHGYILLGKTRKIVLFH